MNRKQRRTEINKMVKQGIPKDKAKILVDYFSGRNGPVVITEKMAETLKALKAT